MTLVLTLFLPHHSCPPPRCPSPASFLPLISGSLLKHYSFQDAFPGPWEPNVPSALCTDVS